MFKKILILSLIIIPLIALGIFLLYPEPLQITEYDMSLMVGEKLCMSGDTDNLEFGAVKPGYSAVKTVTINPFEPAKVTIKIDGSLEKWTELSDNNFVIQTGEITEVDITITPPYGATPGNYTSTCTIALYKPTLLF